MFNYIKGEIIGKNENLLIIENNGIGYEINVSMNTLEMCGIIGEIVKIHTFLSVKEDGISLFGFYSIEEKNLFLNLITVSGVGPKSALQILSGGQLSELNIAISSGDVGYLAKIKGIGKKTAERIVVELKDKVVNFGTLFDYQKIENFANSNSFIGEAIDALISLGLNKTEASRLAKLVFTEGDTTEDIIRKALQNMGR